MLALMLGFGFWRLSTRGAVSGRYVTFSGAWVALVIAFVSPLCALTAALFSARVVHHFVLVLGAAPLLALAFPAERSRSVAAAAAAFTMTMWGWHWPAAYVAAYDTVAGYWAMQVMLLAASIWLWRALLAPGADVLTNLVALVAVSAAMGMLGALLAFAPAPIYPPHVATTEAFGLTALEDQQLGGLLMWVPGLLPFAAAGLLLARARFRNLAAEPAA
ncbi:cytochrome c oxidase assembly protein [Elioraea rosea]|uniref:cytochrome c oxidase assembly protein n=1 Tax=Elioraea rosea TaxID=2492390 RepID=UPI001EF60515|nr:cytochrome c oxidase assembly protein [Elioraea rosea]